MRLSLIITIFFFLANSLTPALDAAQPQPQKKILKSFLSEDAYFKASSFNITDCINLYNPKDRFSLNDDKITWSCIARNVVTQEDRLNYIVCWYSSDGSLFERQTPKLIFTDTAGLKASLKVDREKMRSNTGLCEE